MINWDFVITGDPHVRRRISLEECNPRLVTPLLKVHHYKHSGWAKAQLAYWIRVDGERVGVLLFGTPRLHSPYRGHDPMACLQVCRLWVLPTADKLRYVALNGRTHVVSVRQCALAMAMRRCRQDWAKKFPALQPIEAVIAWTDGEHDEDWLFRALNFQEFPSKLTHLRTFFYEYPKSLGELRLYRLRQAGLRIRMRQGGSYYAN